MQIFPQLSSGANAQYPLARTSVSRTVVNVLADGTMLKFADISAGQTRWQLQLNSLDEAERLAVESLYLASEGQLNTFTLLDPASNLLSWSEDFSKPVWVADPLLEAVGGFSDPVAGTASWQLTNTGSAAQQVTQAINGPAQFEYCFSVYVKGTGNVTLMRSGAARAFTLTGAWQRIESAGTVTSAADTFEVSIVLSAGAAVQVFGPQLEAQPAAGPYRRSLGVSGVYSKVRFESDRLSTAAVGLDRHSSVIRLVSVE